MNYAKLAYVSGALLGLLGVIAGAMGAHALEARLDADALDAYETAVRFQMYHALMLLLLGLLAQWRPHPLLRFTVFTVLTGLILFSGSIYLLTLSPLKPGIVTPIGGLVLIVGWGALLVWALRASSRPAGQ